MSTLDDNLVTKSSIQEHLNEQLELFRKSIELSHARLAKITVDDFFVKMFIKEIRETEDYLIRLIGQQIMLAENALNGFEHPALISGNYFLLIIGIDGTSLKSIPPNITIRNLRENVLGYIEQFELRGQNSRKLTEAVRVLNLYINDSESNTQVGTLRPVSQDRTRETLYHWDSFNTEMLKSPTLFGDDLFGESLNTNKKLHHHQSNISLYNRPGTPISSDGVGFGSSTDLVTNSTDSLHDRSSNSKEHADRNNHNKTTSGHYNPHKWCYVCKITACDYCRHRISVLGLKCKDCRFRCHLKCEKFVGCCRGTGRDRRTHISVSLPRRFSKCHFNHWSDLKNAIKRFESYGRHDNQTNVGGNVRPISVEKEPPSPIVQMRNSPRDQKFLSRQHTSVPIMFQVSIDLDDDNALQRQVTLSTSIKEWDIPIANILIEERMFRGSVSTIYRASWYGQVALRLIDLNIFGENSEQKLRLFKLEVATLKKLRHENLILFCGACLQPPKIGIVTAWITGHSLFYWLHLADEDPLEETDVINWAHQIIMALRYLHSKRCLHKALRTKNIFIEHNSKIIVTDYGLSINKRTCAKGDKYLAIPTYWLSYFAPELMCKLTIADDVDLYHTKESDVYAFGIVFFEMLTQRTPFRGLTNHSIIWKIGTGETEPIMVQDMYKSAKDIIFECWRYEAAQRPTFVDLYIRIKRMPKRCRNLARSPSTPSKFHNQSTNAVK